MDVFLSLAFLFLTGSVVGWIIELIFRRFFSSSNPERKWINPGFLVGPYLPLYGFSLVTLYLLAQTGSALFGGGTLQKILLFIAMAAVITIIEYIAGLIFIKGMKVKLWDYSSEPGNIQGIICPKFSFFWACLSAIYYFLIHPHIIDGINWLSSHLSFSFFLGFAYGIMIIDVIYSMKLVSRIKRFADEYEIIVRYEELKNSIRKKNEEIKEKTHFLLFLRSAVSFNETMKDYLEREKEKISAAKAKVQNKRQK